MTATPNSPIPMFRFCDLAANDDHCFDSDNPDGYPATKLIEAAQR